MDKNVGRISLDSFMFVPGKEITHWNKMVANQKQQILDWHKLTLHVFQRNSITILDDIDWSLFAS